MTMPLALLRSRKVTVARPPGPVAFAAAAEAAAATPRDPPSDLHGSSAYRRHLVGVLVRRALAQAWERTGQSLRA